MQSLRQRFRPILQNSKRVLEIASYNLKNQLRTVAITDKNCPVKLSSLIDTHRRTMSSYGQFTLREISGDLFGAPKSYSLAHCVGADLTMGAGVAVKFKQIYGHVEELRAQNVQTGGVAVLKNDDRFIYYLVTKQRSMDKPTYQSLASSLMAMRKHMITNGVHHLAMPRIGCGIDGLEWGKVSQELNRTFGKDDVEVTVYSFVPK